MGEMNFGFFKTPLGLIKIFQAVLALAAIITLATGNIFTFSLYLGYPNQWDYIQFTTIWTLVDAAIILGLVVFGLNTAIDRTFKFSGLMILNEFVTLVFNFVAFLLSAINLRGFNIDSKLKISKDYRYIAVIAFLGVNSVLYVISSYLSYRWYKEDSPPESVTISTHSAPSKA